MTEITGKELLRMIADGWHGGLGGSVYAHFVKGNKARSFGNGVVFELLRKGLAECDDAFGFGISLTDKGREALLVKPKSKIARIKEG